MQFLTQLFWPIWRLFYQDYHHKLVFIPPSKARWIEAIILDVYEHVWELDAYDQAWTRNFAAGLNASNAFNPERDGALIEYLSKHDVIEETAWIGSGDDKTPEYGFKNEFDLVMRSAVVGVWHPDLVSLRYFGLRGDMTTLAYTAEYNRGMLDRANENHWSYAQRRTVGDQVVFKHGYGSRHVRALCQIIEVPSESHDGYKVKVVELLANGPDAWITVGDVIPYLKPQQLWVDMWWPKTVIPELAEGYPASLAS